MERSRCIFRVPVPRSTLTLTNLLLLHLGSHCDRTLVTKATWKGHKTLEIGNLASSTVEHSASAICCSVSCNRSFYFSSALHSIVCLLQVSLDTCLIQKVRQCCAVSANIGALVTLSSRQGGTMNYTEKAWVRKAMSTFTASSS